MVDKLDSRVTELRVSEEASYGVLGGSPVWTPIEPNSYSAFGGDVAKTTRNPINQSRQRKKGTITDLDSSVSFNIDMVQKGLQDLIQGFMYASYRRKGEEVVTAVDLDTTNPDEYEVASTTGFKVDDLILGTDFTNAGNNTVNRVSAIVSNTSVEVPTGTLTVEASPPSAAKITVVGHKFQTGEVAIDVSGDYPRLTRASGSKDFTTFGHIPGEYVYLGGDVAASYFPDDENNGFKRIRAVATTYIEFDKSQSTMVSEAGTGLAIEMYCARVLKNEALLSSIVERSYQFERTLGASNSAEPTEIQSEYQIGCTPNELKISVPTGSKLEVDLSYIAKDSEQYSGVEGVKAGTRPALVEEEPFNTSEDFRSVRLCSIVAGNEAPSPLGVYFQTVNLTVNNNTSPSKAIGVLGSFATRIGTFAVSAQADMYFADIAAIQAVRQNTDVTLDLTVVRENAGFILDLPYATIGDGKAKVELEAEIMLPLTIEATAHPTMNHTMMICFFDYLPDRALTVV